MDNHASMEESMPVRHKLNLGGWNRLFFLISLMDALIRAF